MVGQRRHTRETSYSRHNVLEMLGGGPFCLGAHSILPELAFLMHAWKTCCRNLFGARYAVLKDGLLQVNMRVTAAVPGLAAITCEFSPPYSVCVL